MNTIKMNSIDLSQYKRRVVKATPIEFNGNKIYAHTVTDLWNKYAAYIPDGPFGEKEYSFVSYHTLIMKIKEFGTELSNPEERDQFINLVKTLIDTMSRTSPICAEIDIWLCTRLLKNIYNWYGIAIDF